MVEVVGGKWCVVVVDVGGWQLMVFSDGVGGRSESFTYI